ncbi:AtuA-related protein [Sphingomonas bacterium]|uniref:AtuA-related protein n=1 Tax=Sphingomonas bacterium TaxID=1895847 RepID=UPI0015769ACF|nr:hypothetical protein [Sphingomonas bacterium]
MKRRLHALAHARAGDKGDISLISVIAYRQADFVLLERQLTGEAVARHFARLSPDRVERFTLPSLGALNFVLHGALRGGVTRSLALDAHGKTLASTLLEIEIDVPE